MRKPKRTSKSNVFVALGLALGLSACGGQPFTGTTSASPGTGWSGQTGCSNENCGGSSSGSGSGQSFYPTITHSFQVTGASGPTPNFQASVNTDITLKVRISADTAPTLTIAQYQNWSFAYGCASFNVNVAGRTVRTGILETPNGNSYYCRYAAWQNNREIIQEQVIDFSDRVTQGNPGPYVVTVSSPQYDFYCNLGWAGFYVGPYNTVCPLRNTFTNGQYSHRVAGFLEVEVDGT